MGPKLGRGCLGLWKLEARPLPSVPAWGNRENSQERATDQRENPKAGDSLGLFVRVTGVLGSPSSTFPRVSLQMQPTQSPSGMCACVSGLALKQQRQQNDGRQKGLSWELGEGGSCPSMDVTWKCLQDAQLGETWLDGGHKVKRLVPKSSREQEAPGL